MSLKLPATHIEPPPADEHDVQDESSEDEDEDEDQTWDDWVSDSLEKRPCKSLFEDKTFDSVQEALAYDETTHGFSLKDISSRLSLDLYRRIRLINWIRKEHPSPSAAAALTGSEEFFNSDDYLKPAIEDDPLLQIAPDDSSDSEDEAELEQQGPPKDITSATRRIAALQRKLEQAKQDLVYYRRFVSERLNLAGLADELKNLDVSPTTHAAVPLRDDDSHYFQSYAENADIHSVMISDKVRTATYAKFILSNPDVFRDAVVMDVGCGTGILSLFAAKAGAKRVFAIDASDIAEKATQIVKDNELDNIITVIRGKVEDIKLPEGYDHVDIIVSEWMGYALLYESMLDSVLNARDRFLKPDSGVMAPSQCKMMFALCEAGELFKERIGFWSDVYGFDLSAMGKDVYDEAIVDVVGSETVLSEPVVVKDLYLGNITAKQLDFSSPFTLVSTAERKTKIHAFVLYFDTFFTHTGEPIPEDTDVYIARDGDPILAEVWPVGGRPHQPRRMSTGEPLKGKGRPKVTSFSTGPASVPTHWKQTLFFLREPIMAGEGTVVEGVFKLRKSNDNSRELDVEIHYRVQDPELPSASNDVTVQFYKVR
ncbi:S-adenosyl-L-methionine-dependent methyltransferase [Cubamyces sp. BRFM 1775]|nr:S-adenosyl-L-methionine-dependent methyltransferase [Cubamyces sp. BRFM 1775]